MTGIHTKSISQKFDAGLLAGESFGNRYRIIEEVGSGGMGKVYKACDLELNEMVALKIIKPEFTDRPDVIARFKRELVLARAINHENVIRIHDLGECDGIKYISMRYIEGQTLKAFVESQRQVAIDKALHITLQICSALHAAHEKGIIHRDLKTSNIMLDRKGKIYVLDFGIACSLDSPTITRTGMMLGTPDYISPEQIMGTRTDIRTDIYSLGVIMYEMLAGRLPFIDSNPIELIQAHLNQEVEPPSRYNPQIPKYLEQMIMKCLQKKPDKRYADVGSIMQEIDQALHIATKHDSNPAFTAFSRMFNATSAQPHEQHASPIPPVARSANAEALRRKKMYRLVAVLAVLEALIIVALVFLLLPEEKMANPPASHRYEPFTRPDEPARMPPPARQIAVSLAMASHIADMILQKSHPFSRQIATQSLGREQHTFLFETRYQGTLIKEYQHKMVWQIELDAERGVRDFTVISDTSPFNAENRATIKEMLASYVRQLLQQ